MRSHWWKCELIGSREGTPLLVQELSEPSSPRSHLDKRQERPVHELPMDPSLCDTFSGPAPPKAATRRKASHRYGSSWAVVLASARFLT